MQSITRDDLKKMREEEIILKTNQFIDAAVQNVKTLVIKSAKDGKTSALYSTYVNPNDKDNIDTYVKDEIVNGLKRVFVDSSINVFFSSGSFISVTVNWE